MKTVRKCVFETNSSSSHSLVIKNSAYSNFNIPINDDGFVEAWFGDFGWGYDVLYSQEEKLSYLLTMVAETELRNADLSDEKTDVIELFESTNGFNMLNNFVQNYCKGISTKNLKMTNQGGWIEMDGYIDHQSCEYNSLYGFLLDYDTSIEEIVLSNGVKIIIDNDNH